MARGTHRCCRIDFKYARKVVSPTRINGKTSAIDCGGYRSTLTCFSLLWLGPWLLTASTGFNLKGGLSNRGGCGEGYQRWWWNSGGS
jgi:hypothetical protein